MAARIRYGCIVEPPGTMDGLEVIAGLRANTSGAAIPRMRDKKVPGHPAPTAMGRNPEPERIATEAERRWPKANGAGAIEDGAVGGGGQLRGGQLRGGRHNQRWTKSIYLWQPLGS